MSANFDAIAGHYDDHFTESVIGKAQRKLVWNYLEKSLPKHKLKILEINCGTGKDADWLAEKGHDVVATDLSAEMIAVAKQKRNLKIQFETAGFSDLKELFYGQKFDLIFSNFAGLNCISIQELAALQHDFKSLLKPEGRFIGIFLGKYCWQERLYFSLKGDSKNRDRRLSEAIADLDGLGTQSTFCFSVNELKTAFSDFQLTQQKPIAWLLPPSYFENKARKVTWLIQLLARLELMFAPKLLADRADHLLVDFRLK